MLRLFIHSLVYTTQGSSSKSLLACEIISDSARVSSSVFDKLHTPNDSKVKFSVGFELKSNRYTRIMYINYLNLEKRLKHLLPM